MTMRKAPLVLAPLAVVTAAFAGIGTLVAGQVVNVRRKPRYPHRVLSVVDDQVTIARDRATQRVGTYGLAWPGGHAVVGDVSEVTDKTIVRPLVRTDFGRLLPGRVAIDHVDVGDPGTAWGMSFEEVMLPSDVGELPAWVLPAEGDVWAVVVHGYGGKRASALSFLPMLRELGLSVVVPAYRNDPDAPYSPDRRYHLGATEWRDVEAAIDHAVERGASRIVLFGWSMGGAIVLQAYAHSAHRARVAALLLDSPVVDWRDVLRHQSRRRHVARSLARYAMRVVERRVDLDFDDLDWVRRAEEIDVPTLIVHGDEDLTVPWHPSSELARRRTGVVELRLVTGAGHVGSWNVDPPGYADAVGAFLDGALGPGAPLPGQPVAHE
ncbi:MAG: hypothetical protein JWO62_3612 [Acidimicrobiaceae bacterium]|nr:hypothetical protein [Acidimicrobiaceae bacterium]